MVVPLSSIPPSREGFYAINNQFLTNGPKGFMEFKMLENEDMYIRIDLPGVPKEGLRVFLDQSKKTVCVFAEAPKEHKHDFSPGRSYGTNTGLVCKCCEISSFTSLMCDGVLRLLLTKTHSPTQQPSPISFLGGGPNRIDRCGRGPHPFPHGTDPNDPALSGRLLMPHPCVNQGSEMAYESKMLQNGGLYVRVDMPGVAKENFTVSVKDGRVMVTGHAPPVSHDSGGRYYSGDVAMLSTPIDIPIRKIKTIAKNGVIRLVIPPI